LDKETYLQTEGQNLNLCTKKHNKHLNCILLYMTTVLHTL